MEENFESTMREDLELMAKAMAPEAIQNLVSAAVDTVLNELQAISDIIDISRIDIQRALPVLLLLTLMAGCKMDTSSLEKRKCNSSDPDSNAYCKVLMGGAEFGCYDNFCQLAPEGPDTSGDGDGDNDDTDVLEDTLDTLDTLDTTADTADSREDEVTTDATDIEELRDTADTQPETTDITADEPEVTEPDTTDVMETGEDSIEDSLEDVTEDVPEETIEVDIQPDGTCYMLVVNPDGTGSYEVNDGGLVSVNDELDNQLNAGYVLKISFPCEETDDMSARFCIPACETAPNNYPCDPEVGDENIPAFYFAITSYDPGEISLAPADYATLTDLDFTSCEGHVTLPPEYEGCVSTNGILVFEREVGRSVCHYVEWKHESCNYCGDGVCNGDEAACDPDNLAEAPYACEDGEISCQIDCCDGNADACPGGVFPAVSQCGDNECEPQWGESTDTCETDCGGNSLCD